MDYPIEILPNAAFKYIDCDLATHFLLRIINTRDINEFWDFETNMLKIAHVCSPREHIQDLSMSLLGIYRPQDIFIQLTESGKIKFNHYCEPDANVPVPVFEEEFILNEDRHYWWVPIDKLSNKEFPYERDNHPFVATCMVEHSPMRWNFWHFSLKWKTDLGDLEDLPEKQKKNVDRRIAHSARALIAKFAIIEFPENLILPKNCYCKN